MQTLVLVEHHHQVMHPNTRQSVAAAHCFEGETIALVVGSACQAVAEEVATLAGVDAVWVVDDDCYTHQLAENVSQLIGALAEQSQVILAPSSSFGKNILPRVAALLDVAQVSDVTRILDANTVEHPIYAGNALEIVRFLDPQRVLTIRATAFEAIHDVQPACTIKHIQKTIVNTGTEWVDEHVTPSARPELTEAKIVVSGGRGLKDKDNFKLIEDLADALGGAVGASRAAVDAGFVPNDYQVGQTGKVVAPELYLAIGISGAVQHLAGMKDSKVIVAINKDEGAPIMQIATYYLVGDLFDLVPQLITQLKGL